MFGNLEAQRNTQYTRNILFNLDNTNYQDSSAYNHGITQVGSVPIVDGGYRFTAANHLVINTSNPIWNIGSRFIEIEFDYRADTTVYTAFRVINCVSPVLHFTAQPSSVNASVGSVTNSATEYGLGYQTGFQRINFIKRSAYTNNQLDEIYWYLNNRVLAGTEASSLGSSPATINLQNATLTISRNVSISPSAYIVKNLKISTLS